MASVKNILIVGVGGQGTILASRILSSVAMAQGFDVKVSEIHGMSQRGGSVVTQVRYGDRVASPIIQPGQADIILAFELLEAYRWLPYLAPEGKVIVNTQEINPMPVITGMALYPKDALDHIQQTAATTVALDALEIARAAHNPKGVNVALIGVLSTMMDIPETIWLDVLKEKVPAKFLEANLQVFQAGRNAVG